MSERFIQQFKEDCQTLHRRNTENSQVPLSPLAPKEITALKYKIIDFIHENDPFGDRISQYELLCLAQYFADAARTAAGK